MEIVARASFSAEIYSKISGLFWSGAYRTDSATLVLFPCVVGCRLTHAIVFGRIRDCRVNLAAAGGFLSNEHCDIHVARKFCRSTTFTLFRRREHKTSYFGG